MRAAVRSTFVLKRCMNGKPWANIDNEMAVSLRQALVGGGANQESCRPLDERVSYSLVDSEV